MDDFFNLLSDHFYELNASMWEALRTRLVLPNIRWKEFPPSWKQRKAPDDRGKETKITSDIPDGIIAHLTRECGGNVQDRNVVEITSGSFEKETEGAFYNRPYCAAKNAADLETSSEFRLAHRCNRSETVLHTRNNWVCYNFKERRIVPTHYTIRTDDDDHNHHHLKSWLVETSVDGENWREVSREENNTQLNGKRFTGTFAVAGGGECRFIRLVNIGRNHCGDDTLCISGWELFGSLIE
jgi:hypothetical protein